RRVTVALERTMDSILGCGTTATVKHCTSLNGGEPLSATATLIQLVPEAAPGAGVHWNTPLVGLIVAPAGAPTPNRNRRSCAGASGSEAELVMVNVLPSRIVRSAIGASAGG